jgi:hypothetical protein
MKKQDLINYMLEFANSRTVFHSEADFQLEFGMFLMKKGHSVRLEKGFKRIGIYPKIELDMELNGKIAIELKYKTSELKVKVGEEHFELKQHGAANLGRFDAIDDARRVKSLVDSKSTKISEGFTVFLTNDSDYWLNNAQRTMSKDFGLIEKRRFTNGEKLDWHSKSLNANSVSKNRMQPFSPIDIQFNDQIQWHDFSEINKNKSGIFRFFVLDVNN